MILVDYKNTIKELILKNQGERLEQLKEVKTVFCDYNSDSFALSNALISNVNLYKKTNVMEIFIQSKELIPIREIYKFEKYVSKRFNLKEVNLKISSEEEQQKKESFISKEWNDILSFLAQKVPVIKAFMKNSKSKIENNKLEVELGLKGKDLLKNRKQTVIFQIL